MGRLADRLNTARHHLFVGREDEQTLFRAALVAPTLPFSLLYICGLGGVGKTTLLHEFAALCGGQDIGTAWIDARAIDPTPDAFRNALALALGLTPPASPLEFLAQQTRRYVLLVDTYEMLAPLDTWLREDFLPQLPDNTLIVLAGRQPLAASWRTDAGWQRLMRGIALRNLSPVESRAYLSQREVPQNQHRAVLDFTHGHPLALSLVADLFRQWQSAELSQPTSQASQAAQSAALFQPAQVPDVVKVLLEHLVQDVPDEMHRTALEACALVRLTTEDLLASVLQVPDAYAYFEWLRNLSFMEPGTQGLLPHDLAREALLADLRWRNPDRYHELHRRARNYYADHLQNTQGHEQERILFDYIFLHRNNPVVRPFLEWRESGNLMPGPARAEELPALLAMVEQHEGQESARLARHWFERQPQGITAIRDATGHLAGFEMVLALNQATPEDLDADPATAAAWRYLQAHAPLRRGEIAGYFRFWMAHDTYQQVSAVQSLIFVNVVRYYLTTPGLAFSFFPCADADFWTPIFAYANAQRVPAAEVTIEGRHYGIYGHDWRLVPPLAWLAVLAERETTTEAPAAAAPVLALVVLSQTEFAAAVQDALKHLSRPAALQHNALLRSRLIAERAGQVTGTNERLSALQTLLKEACESLQATPRDRKFYLTLYHTYVHPAPSQEQAATLIDVPFSTFRRHLKTGVQRVTELLWQAEVGSEN